MFKYLLEFGSQIVFKLQVVMLYYPCLYPCSESLWRSWCCCGRLCHLLWHQHPNGCQFKSRLLHLWSTPDNVLGKVAELGWCDYLGSETRMEGWLSLPSLLEPCLSDQYINLWGVGEKFMEEWVLVCQQWILCSYWNPNSSHSVPTSC